MKYKFIRRSLVDTLANMGGRNVEKFLSSFFVYSSLVFVISSTYFIILCAYIPLLFDFILRCITLILILLAYYLYRSGYVDAHQAILCNSVNITVVALITMGYHMINTTYDTKIIILVEMSVIMVPMIMTALTRYSKLSFIMSIFALLLYSYSAFYLDEIELRVAIPVYLIIYFGVNSVLIQSLKVIEKIKSENRELTSEQQAILDFFNLKRKQWILIKEGKLSRDEAENILNGMELDAKKNFIQLLKETIHNDELVKKILRVHHPDLTYVEIEVAIYIIQGKTVSEIAKIKHVTNSGVTMARSRIKRKVGLGQKDNLHAYLESLIIDHMGKK